MAIYTNGMILGRFQPIHRGHMEIIKKAMELCENLLIVVGSAEKERTAQNPFSFVERKHLIETAISTCTNKSSANRFFVIGFDDDFKLSNQEYAKELYDAAQNFFSKGVDIIFTSEKGIESFYPEDVLIKTAFHIFPRRASFPSGTKTRKMLCGDISLPEVTDVLPYASERLLEAISRVVKSSKEVQ